MQDTKIEIIEDKEKPDTLSDHIAGRKCKLAEDFFESEDCKWIHVPEENKMVLYHKAPYTMGYTKTNEEISYEDLPLAIKRTLDCPYFR